MALNLARLNERQRTAVLHGKGPLLILAGAGSGKTSTMAYRIAHLISERQVPASAILGLSFTRKAADELKERVKKLVTDVSGKSAAKGLTITTFHSLCVQMLRQNAEKLGYQKNFTILDQNDQTDIVKQALRHIKVDDRKFDPMTILFEIGQSKNRFLEGDLAREYFLSSTRVSPDYALVTASAYDKYQEQLKLLNAMDFDDLLFNAVKLLEAHVEVREHYGTRFKQILVDEYQDTNQAQFKLLRLLTEKHQNLCVVGDDDQSIYAWRGADPSHILKFSNHYPDAVTITLDQNYRSTSTILDAANQVISKNKQRHSKSLWSDRGTGEPITLILAEEDRGEAEIVAEELLARAQKNVEGQTQQLRPWKDFAVLYRSNSQSRLFEEALRMRTIPYQMVGGMSFMDRKEVKDTLSYWKIVMNPKDDASVRRVLNWPARGIGKASVEAISKHALESGIPFYEALVKSKELAPRAHLAIQSFCGLIETLRKNLDLTEPALPTLSSWGRKSLELIGIKRALEEEYEDPVQAVRRWEIVDELANALGQGRWKEQTELHTAPEMLQEYLTRMTLEALDQEDDQKDDGKKEKKDQVTLLTLHGAKGLEYPVVFMVGMEDGFLPHQRTIDEATDLSEERRLCYVGITRAKDHLILTRAKNRIRYGKPVPRNPSRFLEEIPPGLMVVRDESHSPDLSSDEARENHESKVKDFLAGIRAQLMSGIPKSS